MQEIHDMDVITVTVDVGQGDNQNKIAKKAKKLGVKKHYNIDAKKEFVTDFIHIKKINLTFGIVVNIKDK